MHLVAVVFNATFVSLMLSSLLANHSDRDGAHPGGGGGYSLIRT